MTAINLTQSEKFTNAKKEQANFFLTNFKFKNEVLKNLQDISKKGYFFENGILKSIFPTGSKKRNLDFAQL